MDFKQLFIKSEYKEKYFVWQEIFNPLLLLIDSIINILLLPFPIECTLHTQWNRHIIKLKVHKQSRRMKIHFPHSQY